MQSPCRPEQAPQSRINLVQQAEDWSDDHSSESIHVIDLSVALNVPLRTLQRIFHETVGMGPAHYMAARKLAKARAALLTADPSATSVTTIACDYGFCELGRFAGAYRRMFGEKPSETLYRRRRETLAQWVPGSSTVIPELPRPQSLTAWPRLPCNNNYSFKRC